MDNTQIIVKRLDAARKQLKLKHRDLAEILALTTSSVSSAFSRKSMKISKIKLLASELGISKDWLFYGNGEMFASNSKLVQENELEYTLHRSKAELANLIMQQQNIINSNVELLKAKDDLIKQLTEVINAYKK